MGWTKQCVHILKKPYFFQCFVFHLYKGVRAGGGIGDEIEPPDGDDYEVYRILFDITFFFFVIVILLAIIQGKKLNYMGNVLASLQQSKSQLSYPIFFITMSVSSTFMWQPTELVKQSLYRPGQTLGLQKLRLPEYLDNQHMELARMSTLCTTT